MVLDFNLTLSFNLLWYRFNNALDAWRARHCVCVCCKNLFATFAKVITITGLKKSRRFHLFPAFLLHKKWRSKTGKKNWDEKRFFVPLFCFPSQFFIPLIEANDHLAVAAAAAKTILYLTCVRIKLNSSKQIPRWEHVRQPRSAYTSLQCRLTG